MLAITDYVNGSCKNSGSREEGEGTNKLRGRQYSGAKKGGAESPGTGTWKMVRHDDGWGGRVSAATWRRRREAAGETCREERDTD